MTIEEIKKIIHSPQFSGVVLVSDNDQVILEDCNGYSDRQNEIEININTRFGIASGTKLFTALGIMKLIEEGKLSLEDKALSFLPMLFPTYHQDITIKHLLTHTSGLPDYFDEDLLKEGEALHLAVPYCDLKKPTDYIPILPKTKMKFLPGEDFNYNNSAFVILAMIIEFITGDYYEWIKTKVLQPANMKSSGFFYMNQLPKNTALGYIELGNGEYQTNIYDLPIIGGGDGGMYTTVEDMNHFWDAFMNGKIVNNNILKQMITPHSHGENLLYGLGVWLKKKGDIYLPLIIGQDPGVSFESGYHPVTKRKYTVISNTETGAWKINGLLLDL